MITSNRTVWKANPWQQHDQSPSRLHRWWWGNHQCWWLVSLSVCVAMKSPDGTTEYRFCGRSLNSIGWMQCTTVMTSQDCLVLGSLHSHHAGIVIIYSAIIYWLLDARVGRCLLSKATKSDMNTLRSMWACNKYNQSSCIDNNFVFKCYFWIAFIALCHLRCHYVKLNQTFF